MTASIDHRHLHGKGRHSGTYDVPRSKHSWTLGHLNDLPPLARGKRNKLLILSMSHGHGG